MRYKDTNLVIEVGDNVVVEGNVRGVVVCDFERKQAATGFEDWLGDSEMVGGGKLSAGVLVKTEALGLVHYPEEDEAIVKQR